MSLNLIREIQDNLGLSENQLNRLIFRAPHSYKVYPIPKRTGGYRIIAQPAAETKFVQYWLINNIFCKLPVHRAATAYKAGASILLNASSHKNNSYLTKFDFKDFFHSITFNDLVSHLSAHFSEDLCENDIKNIARICSIKTATKNELCLSIGAPSSPVLSNSVMFEFDEIISNWCAERSITYTRYADDLAFSSNIKGISSEIEPTIKKVLQNIKYPLLRLNEEKTTHVSKKYQRRITGIIINNEGNVSLGRDRKREISALVHRYSITKISDEEIYYLQGLLGFAKDIEPLFISRMRKKYGTRIIDEILQIRKPRQSSG